MIRLTLASIIVTKSNQKCHSYQSVRLECTSLTAYLASICKAVNSVPSITKT